jgi:hypothetical protein
MFVIVNKHWLYNTNNTNLGHCKIHCFNLNLVVSSYVLNERRGCWLLNNALANTINLCVKLTSEKLGIGNPNEFYSCISM